MIRTVLFFTLSLILFSCSKPNGVLDNGAQENRSLVLDGKTFELKAGAQEAMDLNPGNHKLTVKDAAGVVLSDTSFEVSKGGIVNAGHEGYVIWKLFYGLPEEREKNMKEEWTEIDSVRYFGEFRIISPETPFIENAWDLGPTDPSPDEKTLPVTENYKIIRKIFRLDDFRKKYEALQKK